MTLNLIFGIGVVIGVLFIIWQDKQQDGWSEWRGVTGGAIVIACFLALCFSIPCWLLSEKNSEIRYQQLLQEKLTIEAMISTDKNVDRLLLNERVIEYNNLIISDKMNSTRFIIGDYYSKEVGWAELQPIEWK